MSLRCLHVRITIFAFPARLLVFGFPPFPFGSAFLPTLIPSELYRQLTFLSITFRSLFYALTLSFFFVVHSSTLVFRPPQTSRPSCVWTHPPFSFLLRVFRPWVSFGNLWQPAILVFICVFFPFLLVPQPWLSPLTLALKDRSACSRYTRIQLCVQLPRQPASWRSRLFTLQPPPSWPATRSTSAVVSLGTF